MANKKPTAFIKKALFENSEITDSDLQAAWKAAGNTKKLKTKTINSCRTSVDKLLNYKVTEGLVDFYSSQAATILAQYNNIEHLLGPTDDEWTWIGEHCEILVKESIRRFLPIGVTASKGYIHGHRKDGHVVERCPEIDILIHDTQHFTPIFQMGDFVIVQPEAVLGAIQVKRTLTAKTVQEAVENIVKAKAHVRDTRQFNQSVSTENMFAAIVTFESSLERQDKKVSESFATALKPYFEERRHWYVMPDFIGALQGTFLLFGGNNNLRMGYGAYKSEHNDQNIALTALTSCMLAKIRPRGFHPPIAFPDDYQGYDQIILWENPNPPS